MELDPSQADKNETSFEDDASMDLEEIKKKYANYDPFADIDAQSNATIRTENTERQLKGMAKMDLKQEDDIEEYLEKLQKIQR